MSGSSPRKRAALLAALALTIAAGAVVAARDGPGADAGAIPKLDLRDTLGRDAPFLRDFDISALAQGAYPDQIRAIDEPLFDTPAEAGALLHPSDLVIGIEHGGEAHAYPLRLLSLHEVVNDVVGGLPVAVTWCPLCRTGLAYDRRVGGRVQLFGVSGLLYHRNLVLFDRETRSLWSQLLGGAVTGPHRGTRLARVPVVQETWGSWLGRHPGAPVLSIGRDAEAKAFTDPAFDESPAAGAESSAEPYAGYGTKVNLYYGRTLRHLPDSTLVVGVDLNGAAKAYALAAVRTAGAVSDEVGGEPLLVAIGDENTLSAAVYSRRLDGRTYDFEARDGELVDTRTGSAWSPLTGRALRGPLSGFELARVPATASYWFAWRTTFPGTGLYAGELTKTGG